MGKIDTWPGVGDRLKQAIAKKYLKNGKPDVSGFSLDKRFHVTYVYKWCNADVVPDHENLMRLAKALEVSPAWLLLGDDAHKVPGRPESPSGRQSEQPRVLPTTPATTPAAPRRARPRPSRRRNPLEYSYTWRCSCGFVDGEPVGHEGRDLPESERPACPRCGLHVQYRRIYRWEKASLEKATATSTETASPSHSAT